MTHTFPLFQAAIAGESYAEPDYDRIEQDQDLVDTGQVPKADPSRIRYSPAEIDPDELERIKADMRGNRVQITPDNLRHAIEAEEMRKFLRRYGVSSLRRVSATRDYRGAVKLSFEDFRTLIESMLVESESNPTST